jgi:hypothetical protein
MSNCNKSCELHCEVNARREATVRRLEIIDHKTGGTGRVYSMRPCSVELSYQDVGRTLKIFITDPPIGESGS